MIIMLVGVLLMISAFFTGGARPSGPISVGAGGVTTTTCVPAQIGVVAICPTTTTMARTTTTRIDFVIGSIGHNPTTTEDVEDRTVTTRHRDRRVASSEDELPRTGSPSVPLFLGGLALLAAGTLLLLASRPKGAHLQR